MNHHDTSCELSTKLPNGLGRNCWCSVRKNVAPWQAAEIDASDARIRAELRDRLDRCTDHDHGAAFGWLSDNHPDLVREALDETGAPS